MFDVFRTLVQAKAFPVLTGPTVVALVGLTADVSDRTLAIAGGIAIGSNVVAALRAKFVGDSVANGAAN